MSEPTEDQKRLLAATEELDAVLKKHDIAGVCFVSSAASAAWVHHLPPWSGIVETPMGLDLDLARDDGHINVEQAERAMHVLGVLRDLAYDCTTIYGRLFRIAKQHIRVIGGLMFEYEVEPGRVVEPVDDPEHKMN